MSIPALLKGCTQLLQTALGEDFAVGERPLDGSPMAAYKRGSGWYVGVFFAGASVMSNEDFVATYTLGVSLTRSVPLKKTANTQWFLEDGELFARAGRISQLLMSGRGKVLTACNAALAGQWEEGRGDFHEQFFTSNIGRTEEKSPDWLVGVPGEKQTAALLVVPMTFTGLKFRMLLSEVWGTQ